MANLRVHDRLRVSALIATNLTTLQRDWPVLQLVIYDSDCVGMLAFAQNNKAPFTTITADSVNVFFVLVMVKKGVDNSWPLEYGLLPLSL